MSGIPTAGRHLYEKSFRFTEVEVLEDIFTDKFTVRVIADFSGRGYDDLLLDPFSDNPRMKIPLFAVTVQINSILSVVGVVVVTYRNGLLVVENKREALVGVASVCAAVYVVFALENDIVSVLVRGGESRDIAPKCF